MKIVKQDYTKARRKSTLHIRDKVVKYFESLGYRFDQCFNDLYKSKNGETRRIKGYLGKLNFRNTSSHWTREQCADWTKQLQHISDRYSITIKPVGQYIRRPRYRNLVRVQERINQIIDYKNQSTHHTLIIKITKKSKS